MARPVLVVNPRSDRVFGDAARRLVDEGAQTAAALERSLRLQYPRARVGERRLSGELIVTWYVDRDGVWSSDGGA